MTSGRHGLSVGAVAVREAHSWRRRRPPPHTPPPPPPPPEPKSAVERSAKQVERPAKQQAPPEPKQPGRKRGSGAGPQATAAASAGDASKSGLDAQEAKRQRRLEQNRIAAKKAYDKRVKRQADMEREYESLRQQLQETNAQAATLGAVLSQKGLAGRLRSGGKSPPVAQLDPKSAKSRQPSQNPGMPVAQAPVAVNAGVPAQSARPGVRRVQSIEALTSLVSMVDGSSGNSA